MKNEVMPEIPHVSHLKMFSLFFGGLCIGLVVGSLLTATAAHSEEIGTVETSGWLTPDSIQLNAFDDPDYPGIACYVTTVDRGGFSLENPTDSSIACRLVGEKPTSKLTDNPDVFSTDLNFFKTQKVARFYDEKRNVMTYLSYVRKGSGDNHSHSVSVVPLGE